MGKLLRNKTNIGENKIKTNIKDIHSTPQKPINIKAYQFIGKSSVGKLAARAMTRVPVLSVVASGVVKGLQVTNEVKNGAKLGKSVGKAAIRLTTSTAITAILGAVGAAIGGPIGSLVGMAIAGGINNKIAKTIG